MGRFFYNKTVHLFLFCFSLSIVPFFYANHVYSGQDFSKQIKERQDNLNILKDHMKPLAKLLKSNGDLAEIDIRAQEMSDIFSKLPTLFPAGSSENTDALPEIWTNWDNFVQIARNAELTTLKLAELARTKSTNYQIMFDVFQEIGSHCKACHEKFKE